MRVNVPSLKKDPYLEAFDDNIILFRARGCPRETRASNSCRIDRIGKIGKGEVGPHNHRLVVVINKRINYVGRRACSIQRIHSISGARYILQRGRWTTLRRR